MSVDVVYIDDEPSLLRAIGFVLEDEGLSVMTFSSPQEAIRFVNDNEVGVVLCDYRMPSMPGLEVLAAITTDVPFFLISGDLTLDDLVIAEPRLRGIFPKPLSAVTLAESLKEVLGR